MKSIRAWIGRNALLAYLALTFTISWGGILWTVGGPSGLPGTLEEFERLIPVAVLAILAGPSLAGVLVTWLARSGPGLRDLRSRLLAWRVDARWYAIALLGAPLLMTVLLLALSLHSTTYLPRLLVADDPASVLRFGLTVALGAGFFEELGWTGLVTPWLRRRHGVLATGVILGLVWAAWHLLPAYWFSGSHLGALSLVSFLLDPFLLLVGFRVLMVWVYDRTESLLVGMLMHTSLTASARIISDLDAGALPLITFDLVWAAATWGLIVVVMARRPAHAARRSARGLPAAGRAPAPVRDAPPPHPRW